MLKIVEMSGVQAEQKLEIPLFASRISAGFPAPADDFLERKLDLNEYLIAHPAATFFVRVEGESMQGAGIHSGDLLIVDRSLLVQDGSIIVALLNSEFTVKRVKKTAQGLSLLPENPKYSAIVVTKEMDFEVWGVVTNVIHHVR
jgi:DNA polymerase V